LEVLDHTHKEASPPFHLAAGAIRCEIVVEVIGLLLWRKTPSGGQSFPFGFLSSDGRRGDHCRPFRALILLYEPQINANNPLFAKATEKEKGGGARKFARE